MNKVELKSWFEDDKLYVGEYVKHKIDQLDEPEVLIAERKVEMTVEQAWEVIGDEYGDELLKNNIDYVESNGYSVVAKPVVPSFVGEYIEKFKNSSGGNLTDLFAYADDELGSWWYGKEHFHMLARAWLDGYTVEEKKYYVRDTEGGYLQSYEVGFKNCGGTTFWTDYEERAIRFSDKDKAQLIKNITGGKVEEAQL